MHYYIDGYNLLFQTLERQKTFTENREEIIELLVTFFNDHNLQGSLVFDSRYEMSTEVASILDFGHLEIIYAPGNVSADDYLVEILSIVKHPKAYTTITSDNRLSSTLKGLGCNTMTVEVFFDWTLKKKKSRDRRRSYEKNIHDTTEDFERLLKAFEKKFEDLN